MREIVSPLSGINSPFGQLTSPLAIYAVLGIKPQFVLDFGPEKYFANRSRSTFSNAITHSAASNATMVDGYGPELVTNGTFDTDTAWTKGTGWTISGGVASFSSGADANISQNSILTVGKVYQITFDVTAIAGGNLSYYVGTSGASGTVNSVGSYTNVVTAAANGNLAFRALSATNISIDNVSIKEIPVLKWRPHNLVTYSEQFDNAAWGKTDATVTSNAAVAPDGTMTADLITGNAANGRALQIVSSKAGISYTFSVWLRAVSGTVSVNIRSVNSGVAGNVVATETWQKFEVTESWPSDASRFPGVQGVDTGEQVLVWGAHLYRSDLGGMVNNPDRGDSYVPTTSSAVYLPRRGHHVYNGDTWVNKGLLHESETRTNLVTYSEDFTDASWTKTSAATLSVDAIGPDGKTSAVTLVDSGATGTGQVSVYIPVTVSTSTAYTWSAFVKADQLSWVQLYTNAFTTPANGGCYFNLSDGSIGSAGSGFTPTIEDFGNGWYRCSITFTTDATDTSGNVFIRCADSDNDVTVDLDGTSSILIYGAQFEQGSTPSSYIPTSGATVTRSAETLTVPAANLPWPSPVVIGEELVTNGTFDTDTDWTKGAGWSISGGVASNDGTINAIYQSKAIEAGKLYACTIDITFNSPGVAYWRLGDSTNLGVMSVDATSYTQYLIGSADGNYIGIFTNTNITIDNISVKEINPLSVSIQMQGEMTYADDGNAAEVYWLRWVEDVNTGLFLYNSTAGANTGQPTFQQESSNVLDGVVGSATAYTPGVNVPFNIASRHGSTFINGAVDGTALTADTTPVALPDLSATDLQLGYDYMGTISLFRIWADDLTDAGIAEASAPSTVPSLSLTFDGASTSFTDTGMTV